MQTRSLLILLAAALLGCASGDGLPDFDAPAMAPPAAPIEFEDLRTGEPISLAHLGGQVVVLDVWATWCAPCVESLPELDRFAHDFASHDVAFVALSIDDDREATEAFVREHEITLPVWRDPSARRLVQRFRFTRAPTTYVLDREGHARFVHEGASPELHGRLHAQLEQLLSNGNSP